MIATLSIKNYALIEDLRIEFKEGLTVITGETGAGKSIILGAMGLLMGKRANLDNIKDSDKKCVIEGQFNIESYNLQTLFEENDLDYFPQTIIRREILPGGRSRAFVNDTPATLNQIQALANHLIDIHSQHETLEITSEEYQLELLDALAKNSAFLSQYKSLLHSLNEVRKQLKNTRNQQADQTKELDYNQFLLEELQQAKLEKLNQQELEDIYNTLSNSENIQESLAEIIKQMTDEQIGVLETAKQARQVLSRIQSFSAAYESYWERLNSTIIELEDLTDEITSAIDSISSDPKLLEEVNEKLQLVYKLQQKHSVASVEELRDIENSLSAKVTNTLALDDAISRLEKEEEMITVQLHEVAKNISANRKQVIPDLKSQLEKILTTMGLPNAFFEISLKPGLDFRLSGTDTLELLFSANKGIRPGNIGKVASGGELSRIMLAVKSVLGKYKHLPTLVFDEIDSGVSGEIANKMASLMVSMSSYMQIFTITHLPQVAAKGKQHLKVYKTDSLHSTTTHLKVLSKEERLLEIAEMLGGKKISDAAIANAKELLN